MPTGPLSPLSRAHARMVLHAHELCATVVAGWVAVSRPVRLSVSRSVGGSVDRSVGRSVGRLVGPSWLSACEGEGDVRVCAGMCEGEGEGEDEDEGEGENGKARV